ncbi:hypothetical protein ACFL0D_06115 [Thermoproteota archaeon]
MDEEICKDSVEIILDVDKIEIGVEINGVKYFCDEECRIEIQIDDLKGFYVGSIPNNITFWPLEKRTIVFNGEISSSSSHPGIAYMNITDYRKYWNHKYGMGQYYIALREVIISREKKENDVQFSDLEDDGAWIRFKYEIFLDENVLVDEALKRFQEIEAELMGQTERILNREEIPREVLKNESRFILEVILPLLRIMEFNDIKYNHGVREYGKDATFSEVNKFGVRKNIAIQVKAGNISGKAGSDLDKIIGQIDDAFNMPYIDISSRERRYISELLIIISGRFTDNAKEKIIEKVGQRNISFFDIDKVEELLTKYLAIKLN